LNGLFSYDTECLPKVRIIGRIKYHEPWQHFPRSIDEYIMYFIIDGDMYIEENETRYHLKSGDFFLLEPNMLHKGFKKASCDYYYVHFKHSGIFRVVDEAEGMRDLLNKRKISLVSYCLDEKDPTDPISYLPKKLTLPSKEYCSMLHASLGIYCRREEHYKRVVSTEFHRFLLKVAHDNLNIQYNKNGSKHVKKYEEKVEGLIYYLNANYSQKLSGNMIEELFEVNFDYINRVFLAATGSTIFNYINALRINNAKQLIATTNLPFGEVGYLVGVEDRYYFSKLFRKFTGMTPSEYYESQHMSSQIKESR
jgi:YesN/AraC family two-component response regulator